MRADSNRAGLALAALLTITGVTHFLAPGFYDPIVPHALPGSPRTWVYASGVAELVVAAALARARSRRLGATLAVVLLVVVFPANIQMAVDWRHDGVLKATAALVRLPLQIPLIWWAWRVRRGEGPPGWRPRSRPWQPRRDSAVEAT